MHNNISVILHSTTTGDKKKSINGTISHIYPRIHVNYGKSNEKK